ncbi:hypothetical protein P22_2991 [Propionispora sp. 2/2-37]|uniref:prephenate dehydrogenase n=1 Tax=Propionispora sp. 2/2-37 TaxID=1677858 RepID=UPI0006BB892B|nr:prephenate dehydrogenase [Propionispora sp. 2/2-37]CUH96879.1 hypothetical protein P22_2991 [Propionispora sp. 2/2-37]
MSKIHICIIGMGLIGGSLGLALKEASYDQFNITAVDNNPQSLKIAVERGAADQICTEPSQGVRKADIVFICTPVLQIVPIVEQILPFLKKETIITDVGSTKEYLAEKINAILPAGISYVGGHPMAGREQSGIEAADKTLFRNKWYIFIPEVSTSLQALKAVTHIIEYTGANITTMKVKEHDRCAAVISHVPHVAAASMVNLLDFSHDADESLKLAGGGFRDTTRIASSNADMWADICLTNGAAITDGLEDLRSLLAQVILDIERGNRQAIHDFFSVAKKRRDALLNMSL